MTEKVVINEEWLFEQTKKLNNILDDIIDDYNYYSSDESNINNLVEDAKQIISDIDDEGAFFSDIIGDMPLYLQNIVIRNGKIESFNIDEKQLEKDYYI